MDAAERQPRRRRLAALEPAATVTVTVTVERVFASQAALGAGEVSADALPAAAFVGVVGFGADTGDVVVEVLIDAVARERPRGPVPFLTPRSSARGFAEGVVQPARSGVELAIGDVVADASTVALEVLDLAVQPVALAADLLEIGAELAGRGAAVALERVELLWLDPSTSYTSPPASRTRRTPALTSHGRFESITLAFKWPAASQARSMAAEP